MRTKSRLLSRQVKLEAMKTREDFRNKKVAVYQVRKWDRPLRFVIRTNIIFISACNVKTVTFIITIVPVLKTFNVFDG
jgi:hypothetical protein